MERLDERVDSLLRDMEGLFRGKHAVTDVEYQQRAKQLAGQAEALTAELEGRVRP
jgi:hypothetical protein